MTAIVRALLLLPLFCAACDKADADSGSGATPVAADAATAAAREQIIGVWVGQGDSGEIYTLTAERFDAVYPKLEGAKPMNGPYTIVKVDGAKITIKPMLELPGGKTFAGDEQIITIVDADTIDRRNAKNDVGGVFKRKKA